MKFQFFRTGLAAAAIIVSGVAAAQSAPSIDVWFNKTGNTAHSGTISATAGSTLSLTVYFTTTNFTASGGLSQLGAMLGFSSSLTSGAAAVPTDPRLTYVPASFGYNNASYTASNFFNGLGGGSGPGSGTARPYGYAADIFSAGSIANTDGIINSYYSLSVTVAANAAGQTITVPLYVDTVDTNPGTFSTYAYAGSTKVIPTQFSANIVVAATPEPATMAVLGLGLLAVVRRRRK